MGGNAYRDRPGRQIAGVTVALAALTGLSVTLVRLAFILLTFVSFIGPVLYVAFWLVLPFEPGGVAPLTRATRGISEEPGAPAPLERLLRWLGPKVEGLKSRLRGGDGSPEGSS